MNISAIIGILSASALTFAVATPVILLGIKPPAPEGRYKLILWAALIFLATHLATGAEWIFERKLSEQLYWNWGGKLAALLIVAVVLWRLPRSISEATGIFNLPARNSLWPILIVFAVLSVLGVGIALASREPVGLETVLYQLFMPSLSEELVFRAILPALLAAALGSPWDVLGAKVGWWWPVCALLFGGIHGIAWNPQTGLGFYAMPFLVTLFIGLVLGWLAARCRSVWPAVAGHSLLNTIGPILKIIF